MLKTAVTTPQYWGIAHLVSFYCRSPFAVSGFDVSDVETELIYAAVLSTQLLTRKNAVDYYTTAYRRYDTDVAYGGAGATWRVMFEKKL